ncbi:MAG: TIM-barrel domain-containing protein [Spirochaetia bacterium]
MKNNSGQLYFSEDRSDGIVVEDRERCAIARVQSLSPGIVRVEVMDKAWPAVDAPTLTVASRPTHRRGVLRGTGTTIDDGVISLNLGKTGSTVDFSGSAESDNRRRIISALSIERADNRAADSRDDTHSARLGGGDSFENEKERGGRTLGPLEPVDVPSEGIRLPRSPFDSRTPSACRSGIWYFRDAPRVVAPWETLSAILDGDGYADTQSEILDGDGHPRTQGNHWRIDRFAGDWYIFAWRNDPDFLRREFLNLTGRVPLPPLWMFGIWHSRYYPYTASEVIGLVDEYRRRGFPLDTFVIDTDWREGASRGYRINETLFDDMGEFLRECHDHGVRVMFNDHPEHRLRSALDDGLLRYREHNLQRLQEMGLDGWWFDRNWREIFLGPDRGVESSVWGQFLYWEIDRRRRGHGRVPLLSMRTDHPAGHRYPVWWTGDIYSDWDALAEAIEQTIDSGTQLFPYTGQDIGGHIGFPSPEQYVRWIQWATVSPTFRLHCGPRNREREPWKFGARSEAIARAYTKLRMRLIPLLYSEAREATVSGTPLLRDAGLVEPEFAERQRRPDRSALTDQCFLGRDLWIAPVHTPAATGSISEADAGEREEHEMSDVTGAFDTDFHQLEGEFIREVFAPRDPFRGIPLTDDFQPAADARLIERGHTHEVRLSPTWASRDRGNWGNEFFVRWRGSWRVARSGNEAASYRHRFGRTQRAAACSLQVR